MRNSLYCWPSCCSWVPRSPEITTYTGFDLGSGSTATNPNSDAAALALDTATGFQPKITFESAPLGPYSSLVVAPGVTLTGSDSAGTTRPSSTLPHARMPCAATTSHSGGSQWADVFGGTITFTFSTRIKALWRLLHWRPGRWNQHLVLRRLQPDHAHTR